MGRINCSVEECSHCNSGSCCANFVEVKGSSAREDDDTFCSSFLAKSVYGDMINSSVSGESVECDSLACDVESCQHHAEGLCELSEISVGGVNASTYDATKCNSFVEK